MGPRFTVVGMNIHPHGRSKKFFGALPVHRYKRGSKTAFVVAQADGTYVFPLVRSSVSVTPALRFSTPLELPHGQIIAVIGKTYHADLQRLMRVVGASTLNDPLELDLWLPTEQSALYRAVTPSFMLLLGRRVAELCKAALPQLQSLPERSRMASAASVTRLLLGLPTGAVRAEHFQPILGAAYLVAGKIYHYEELAANYADYLAKRVPGWGSFENYVQRLLAA